eukprot:3723345-Rhodomonas_salina.1
MDTISLTKRSLNMMHDDFRASKKHCASIHVISDMTSFSEVEPSPNSEISMGDLNRCESGASFSDNSGYDEQSAKRRVTSSPSESSCQGDIVDVVVKKKKHNLVEQNRRETTRSMISDLKDMVGADGGTAQHPNINKVLEGTLNFLKKNIPLKNAKPPQGHGEMHPCFKPDMKSLPFPDRDFGRYLTGFDAAPFGIICAQTDGVITRVNNQVEDMFKLPRGFAMGKIMFALCAEHHMPMAMGAANTLLTGKSTTVQLVKDCVGSSGKAFPFMCQYSCIWRDDKPVGIIVYIRPEKTPSCVNFVE